MSNETGSNKLTRTQLSEMIGGMVSKAVADAVQEASQQTTDVGSKVVNVNTGAQPDNADMTTEERSLAAARFLRALAFANNDMNKAQFFAEKSGWGNDRIGKAVMRSLQAGNFSQAGALIPSDFAAGVIELLRSRTVIRRAGPRSLPMPNGSITLRKQTEAATASYVGESRNIPSTKPSVGQIVMTAKKLAAIVPISNDLLMYSNDINVDQFVRDDLVQVLSIREDRAFLRDDGTENKPKGIRHWMAADHVMPTNGSTAANIEEDFKDMINALEGSDIRMERCVWLMHPRSKNHLVNLRDPASGVLLYPEMRAANPTLHGFPVLTTTSIPVNLGMGGNESEVYLIDMVHVVIGEVNDIDIAVDASAAYVEGTELVSTFARDEVAVRAIMRHDIAMRHEEAAAVKTGVTWGA